MIVKVSELVVKWLINIKEIDIYDFLYPSKFWRSSYVMLFDEIYKICKRRLVILMVLILFAAVFIFIKVDGEYTNTANVACKEDGITVTGREAVEYNRNVALSFQGKVTDALLKQIHDSYKQAPHSEYFGSDTTNSTYDYFISLFGIDNEDYNSVKEVYPDYTGDLIYGFADNWKALWTTISRLSSLFPLFIIIMAAPLFSYERECNMKEMLSASKNGKFILKSVKIKAAYIVMNSVLAVCLLLILAVYLFQYGIEGYNTSIQCGYMTFFDISIMECSYLQLVIHTVLLLICGCNLLLSVIIVISLKTERSFISFGVSLVITYIFSYRVVHSFTSSSLADAVFAFIPINVSNVMVIANTMPVLGIRPETGYFIILEIYCIIVLVIMAYGLNRMCKNIKSIR